MVWATGFTKLILMHKQVLTTFYPTILPWHAHPDRDDEWFEEETKNMSQRQVAQEYECNFNMSGETVIHPDDMAAIKVWPNEIQSIKLDLIGTFWIWEEYQPGASYLLVADVARGDDKDSSVFHIMKLSTMEIIGEYKSKITPDLFANMLNEVGREFGECLDGH
jgi:hypothetical protein